MQLKCVPCFQLTELWTRTSTWSHADFGPCSRPRICNGSVPRWLQPAHDIPHLPHRVIADVTYGLVLAATHRFWGPRAAEGKSHEHGYHMSVPVRRRDCVCERERAHVSVDVHAVQTFMLFMCRGHLCVHVCARVCHLTVDKTVNIW